MRISVILLGLFICLIGFNQDAHAEKETYSKNGNNFKVTYTIGDFSWQDAEDLAKGLQEAWDFYERNNFTMPPLPAGKIKVKLKKKDSKHIGGYDPVSRSITIKMPCKKDKEDEDGDGDTNECIPTGENDTRAKRRFTAAHELFHAVTFQTLPFNIETYWAKTWLKKKTLSGEAEFWFFFEGLAETMAWMVFPDIGADINDGETAHARFWYAPVRNNDPLIPWCGAYPYTFVNPWKILQHCALTEDPELLAYYTIPFWLGLSQRTFGPPDGGNYDVPAGAILQVINAVNHQFQFQSSSPDAIKAGVNAFLSSHGLERKDIRDMMSLSAGVERFGDEIPSGTDSDWTALFRDFEKVDNEIEDKSDHLSWAIDYTLDPPNIKPKNTINFQSLVTNLAGEEGQLESFNYAGSLYSSASEDDLPTFAGDEQGIHAPNNHPLDTTVVPPGTIQLMDLTRNPSQIAQPVAVAGYRTAGETLFPPRIVKVIPGEGVTLPLHSFRLRDLSVMRVLGRTSHLQYRYTFLDENKSQLGYGKTTLTRPEDGEWLIREVVKPDHYNLTHYLPGALVMLTPATVPNDPAYPAATAWRDSDTFDLVTRSENTSTGSWANVSASTNDFQVSVPFPVGNIERVRVDIARFEPGDHGGGNFLLTAAHQERANPNKPDLLVRASTVAFSRNMPPLIPLKKCQPTAKIVAYVTNQGNADASGVSVRIKGKIKITLNKQGTKTDQVPFDQTISVPQVFQPGETRAVKLEVQANSAGFVTSVQGKIIIDPNNGVDEHVESNNQADISPGSYECGS